jgi:pimeloyl-ACP methyl ester carboxylesterase
MRLIALIVLVATCAGCSGDAGSDAAGANAACKGPAVIFVHGLGQDASIFRSTIAFFTSKGVAPRCLAAVTITPSDASSIIAAETFVSREVRAMRQALDPSVPKACRKVHLVGHSMGALAVRWYVGRVGPSDGVASVITTSGANHGTNWNCDKASGPGHREMCPAFAKWKGDSRLQFGLNGTDKPDFDETPWGIGTDSEDVRAVPPESGRDIAYATIRSRDDRYILPGESSELDGAGGIAVPAAAGSAFEEKSPGNFVARELVGHDELLESPQVMQLLHALIEARQAAVSRKCEAGRTD